ncbi:MAG: right-handed parallel beta-helix repeat-containing protein [Parafilimonas sp.]
MRKFQIFFLVAFCACTKTEQTPVKIQDNDVSEARNTPGHKRIILKQGGDGGAYISNNNFSYSPGDTLVLTGTWSYCTLDGICGNAKNSVVLLNQGSQVQLSSGFSFTNCRYIRLLGRGSSDNYGFRISVPANDGVGITITGRSSHITVSNVDIYNKTYGFWVKQEASCVDSLQYPNWTINHIKIHDCRIKKANQEAMYLGSTDPNGTRAINCNGQIIYPKPLRLAGIKVYNMIIDSTYRSGIQLSCASQGDNEIYNNTITNCGFEYVSNGQGSGISLGGYSQANIHDNTIINTYTMGISSLGAGLVTIENNIVKNSGILGGFSVPGMASIMIDTRNTNPADSTTFQVKNNTLGDNTDVNIRVYETYPTYTSNNIICNNGSSTKIAIVSGIEWTSCP